MEVGAGQARQVMARRLGLHLLPLIRQSVEMLGLVAPAEPGMRQAEVVVAQSPVIRTDAIRSSLPILWLRRQAEHFRIFVVAMLVVAVEVVAETLPAPEALPVEVVVAVA